MPVVGVCLTLLFFATNIYLLHPMKSAILIFFTQISGDVKRLSCPYNALICLPSEVSFGMQIKYDHLIRHACS
jgi:hypothetical protein